jgi:hypothetical protein
MTDVREQDINAAATFKWVRCMTPDDIERFFESILPVIRATAKEIGYAIGVHGSMRRDLDLIAVPWVATHSNKDHLARAIQIAACGISSDSYQWEEKPCGRVAASFPVCWTQHDIRGNGHIDLSVVTPNMK